MECATDTANKKVEIAYTIFVIDGNELKKLANLVKYTTILLSIT